MFFSFAKTTSTLVESTENACRKPQSLVYLRPPSSTERGVAVSLSSDQLSVRGRRLGTAVSQHTTSTAFFDRGDREMQKSKLGYIRGKGGSELLLSIWAGGVCVLCSVFVWSTHPTQRNYCDISRTGGSQGEQPFPTAEFFP